MDFDGFWPSGGLCPNIGSPLMFWKRKHGFWWILASWPDPPDMTISPGLLTWFAWPGIHPNFEDMNGVEASSERTSPSHLTSIIWYQWFWTGLRLLPNAHHLLHIQPQYHVTVHQSVASSERTPPSHPTSIPRFMWFWTGLRPLPNAHYLNIGHNVSFMN